MVDVGQIQAALADVLRGYDVKEVFLFGSYARGSQDENSDIDLRFQCGKSMTFSQLYDIQRELESVLGVGLDIVTAAPEQMRPSFYRRIKQDEVRLYAAA